MAAVPSHKRRRSSDGTSASSPKFTAVQSSISPPMLISLPTSSTAMERRSPLTPPSVTPACITVSDHTPIPRDERCQSPRATALLAKVAVVSAQPPVPTGIKGGWAARSPNSGANSLDTTPTSTPPEDGGQFSFSSRKSLPESPGGTYISFPEFETFGGYESEEEETSPQRKR
ncbi:hypothetical protein EX30DRAFT_214403 [Ascodesmis nigricans]|uniref:Uncharacterized protein n=1 Tax=Ascodesmis nigricans TaxID=341454 RepID=A0A4S2MZJ3_9PEZI|nr:hypothetical protein EX30DRAFT_214403 [Ascodesmis nigricans]